MKMDCAIKLVALVEAGSSTGYLAEVTRSLDKEMRYVSELNYHILYLIIIGYSYNIIVHRKPGY